MNGKAGYQVRDLLLFRVLSSFRAGPPIAMALLAQLFLEAFLHQAIYVMNGLSPRGIRLFQ